MKVALAFETDVKVPLPSRVVKSSERKDGKQHVFVTEVAFAEEIEETVDIEFHTRQEFTLNNCEIVATYDM